MMKKISLKELRMLIKTTKEDICNKSFELRKNAVIVHHLIGNESIPVTTPFNFTLEFDKLEELRDNLTRYEILAQEANTNIKVEGMSLTEIIKRIKSINERIESYNRLLKEKPSKIRVDVQNSGTFYYEEQILRFDIKKIESMRDNLREEVQKLEVMLDKANTEPIIEI